MQKRNFTISLILSLALMLTPSVGRAQWNALTNPTGPLSLSMGTNQTTFTWSPGSATSNITFAGSPLGSTTTYSAPLWVTTGSITNGLQYVNSSNPGSLNNIGANIHDYAAIVGSTTEGIMTFSQANASGAWVSADNSGCQSHVNDQSNTAICQGAIMADVDLNPSASYPTYAAKALIGSMYYPTIWAPATLPTQFVGGIGFAGISIASPTASNTIWVNAMGTDGTLSVPWNQGLTFYPGSISASGEAILIDAAGPLPATFPGGGGCSGATPNLYPQSGVCIGFNAAAPSGTAVFQSRNSSGAISGTMTLGVNSGGVAYMEAGVGTGGFWIGGGGGGVTLQPASGYPVWLGGATTITGMLSLSAEASYAGQAACFKSSGTVGYCSTAVNSSGGCTCN